MENDELIGSPRHEVRVRLRKLGLRPTRQRVALGCLLLGKSARHLTADMLYKEALRANVPTSLATIYNVLRQFTAVGLLRQIPVNGKIYLDTDTSKHQHFFIEDEDELIDIRDTDILFDNQPTPPEGYEVTSLDVIVRLRRKF
jgi:Fur family transcriptional regulator, iron response regulator